MSTSPLLVSGLNKQSERGFFARFEPGPPKLVALICVLSRSPLNAYPEKPHELEEKFLLAVNTAVEQFRKQFAEEEHGTQKALLF